MGSKQKASSKKKGPKGKKARAKAKLERQWGEVPLDDGDRKTQRVGNSRLLGKTGSKAIRWGEAITKTIGAVSREGKEGYLSKRTTNPINTRFAGQYDGSSSSDESSDDNSMSTPAAVSSLLSSIRKSSKGSGTTGKRKTIEKATYDHGPEDDLVDEKQSEDESSSEEDDLDLDDPDEIAEGMNDDDEDSVEADNDGATIDFFRKRFNRELLSKSELSAGPPAPKRVLNGAPLEFLVSSSGDEMDDLLVSEKDPAKTAELWKTCSLTAFQGCRKVLQQQWKQFNRKVFASSQAPIYAPLARYADLFVTANSMKTRNEMHRLYMMHVLNHVLTSRSRIQRHNRQLKDIEKEEDAAMEDDNDDRFRDQGFTRATVLVLLPTRSTCYRFVEDMFKLSGNDFDNVHNERFKAEFGDAADGESSDEEQSIRRKAVLAKKGKDWNELFGDSANNDDDFKLGLSLTPKAAKGKVEKMKSSNVGIKLFSDFYRSDIIVASPLGLKLLITPEEEEEEGDYDYLSSIEICLVQYSDVLLMQNWDHINDILALLNKEPQNNNNTDFSRVRKYLLEGQGARWRQLIISSKFMDPYLTSTFKRFGKSLSGSVKMRRQSEPKDAAIANVLIPIKQVFQKVPTPSFAKQSEARVDYFVKSILPQILRHKQKHTMVYVPSYFDFCSLRNYLLKRDISFVSVHEYSRTSEVTRGRARFLQGRKPLMLYTGRCNFFHRHNIKGVRHLVFLGLPEHPEFYSDLVNEIVTTTDDSDIEATATGSSCVVLCSRFEALALERIVGSSNCARMLKSEKSTFMFYA